MSDPNNHPISASNTSNATDLEYANPSASPPIISSTNLGPPTSSISTHAVAEGLGNCDGEAQNTTLTNSKTDYINGQAEHGNSARNTSRGDTPQRRGMPITLVIPPLPGMTATVGQELGLDGSATGNGMLQNAPSEPTRDVTMDNSDSLGVPRANVSSSGTLPPCPSQPDNFESFGIRQPADFAYIGATASELSRSMRHSTPPRATAALSSYPPVEGNDSGVSGASVTLVDLSNHLSEWSNDEGDGSGSQHENSPAQDSPTTPTNEILSINVSDLRLRTPAPERLAMIAPFSQYPENETSGAAPGEHTTASNRANSTNPVRGHGLAAVVENEHDDHGDGRAMARPNTPIDPPNGSNPSGQTNFVLNGSNPVDRQGTGNVQENTLDGQGYSIYARQHVETVSFEEARAYYNNPNGDNNSNRRDPRPAGSLSRTNREQVGAFWNDLDGSGSDGDRS